MASKKIKRRKYVTWDDAFHGLSQTVRQESARVAAYTQALYVQACADQFCTATKEGKERIQGKYADLSFKCGMYHQLGKALVPPEYQLWQEDFTEEERAVYRKYTSDGRLLMATLQERGGDEEKMKGGLGENPTRNIPWLMLRESCEQHMERWDGSGYPAGLRADEISPIAQIVGIAKALDDLCANTKSENPFDDAYRTLVAQAGSAWNPALVEVLQAARAKCRGIYKKYIHYTKTLPATIPLVEKKKDRPMGLTYRPMVADDKGTVVAYEAIPWFAGVAGDPGKHESIAELEAMFRRKNLTLDISFYLLYEAADTVFRSENCQLNLRAVLLQMLPDFYTSGTQLQRLLQLFKDQPIPKEKLMLTVPAELIAKTAKSNLEIMERYLRNGIVLLVDDYDPAVLPAEKLKEMGFTHLRLAPTLYGTPEIALAMTRLHQAGFTLLGGEVEDHKMLSWLEKCHVSFASGPITGLTVSEDELIRDALAREK
ncbi:MAG: EAL domain-containing protein [Oscillospiraceae bacterium]|nr:EAL domain-containing protein [Oscillospiraceae bacterium]